MSFICKLFRRWRRERPDRPLPKIEPTSISTLTIEELLFYLHVNEYLKKNDIPELEYNEYAQTFANFRTWFWEFMGYKKTLHYNLFGDSEVYTDANIFTSIEELSNYNIYGDLNGFIKSKSHHDKLISGKWKYIGISMREKWCCVILAK